jgi:hypothetical protein
MPFLGVTNLGVVVEPFDMSTEQPYVTLSTAQSFMQVQIMIRRGEAYGKRRET